MRNLKRSLLVSGLSLAVCLTLLIGTTFAWFTSNVTNNNNTITAGRLKIAGYAYDSVAEGTAGATAVELSDGTNYYFSDKGQNLREDNSATIGNNKFDPTKTYTKVYEVKNEGTLDFRFKFDFLNTYDGGLGELLWFDLVPLGEANDAGDSKCERALDPKNLSEMEGYFDDNAEGTVLSEDENQKYLFIYGLNDDESADYFNEYYKNYHFRFDIDIKAAQINGEFPAIPVEDKFVKDIANADDVADMMRYINNGNDVDANLTGSVELDNLMTISSGQTVKLELTNGAVFDIPNQIKSENGFDNSANNDPYVEKSAITVKDGATLELTGTGTLQSDTYKAITVEEGGSLKINGVTVDVANGYKDGIYAIDSAGNLEIEDATINAFTDNEIVVSESNSSPLGGSYVYGIYARGGTLSVKNCSIDVTGATNGNTVNGAYGIYVNGAAGVEIVDVNIKGTGQATSQYGIYCKGGSIDLISGVTADIKGTAVDTWESIVRIEKSTLKGSAYSLRNRSGTPIEVTKDTTLTGKTSGSINRVE